MHKKLKWGIIGLGKIATKFAEDLLLSPNAVLYGVASRDLNKAKDFSAKFKAQKNYGSYQELAEDPDINVVYIATPHAYHFANTMLCFKNNKSVLCEKPMGVSSKEVAIMNAEAKSKNLFLMEGLWTRFMPATEKLITLLETDTIGAISFIKADFGFKAPFDLTGRLFNKELGGGSLLDVGIYPIYLSLLLLGLPIEIKAIAGKTTTNVDGYCDMLFSYKNDVKAHLASSIESKTPTEAYIYGSKGVIKLETPFHHTQKITIYKNGNTKEILLPYEGNGYLFEIEEVNKCLNRGETKSKKHSLSTSKNLMYLIDWVKQIIDIE